MQNSDILKLIKEKEEEKKKLNKEIEELKNEYKNSNKVLDKRDYVKLFMSYFKGRSDVYPYLSVDKNKEKVYYIPACVNEWKKGICNKTMGKACKNCEHRVNKILDEVVVEEHIFKGNTIGIYPMLEDETCYFLAMDFDNKMNDKDIKEDVLAFIKVCESYGIDALVERSRSGKGFHIWIFFENNIKASMARKMGSLLLSKTMEERDSLGIDSFDRMFPNQDFMPKGGFGNLIVLPWQKECRVQGNSVFVDKNFEVINNQLEYLKGIRKLKKEEISKIINRLTSETIDISHDYYDIKEEVKDKKKNDFKFPKSIKVTLDDMVYIEKKGLSGCVKNCFRRLATFANPEFYQKERLRLPIYNTPMVIDCSKENDKYLMLPRGTFEYLGMLCNDNGVKMKVTDKRNLGLEVDYKFKGELREEQSKALMEMMKFDNGILYAPTGFGKTVISCKLISERKVNTLIITHTLQLLKQWKERLGEFLDIDEIGQIGGGKNIVTNKVDVASIRTIWNKGKFSDVVKNYGMIIIDECHHLAAFTYESAVNKVNAKYVYGVTATPNRENGHTPIIKMQCGDIRYEVDFKKFNKNLNMPMKVYVKNNHLLFVDKNITDYTFNEINNYIVKDVVRSEKIIKDIKEEFEKGKNVLVLTERIEHLEYFKEKLSLLSSNVIVYFGGLGKKEVEMNDKLKENVKDNKIVLATGSCVGEGFDDKSLDVLFLTMPISGITRVTQYTGRLHRKNKDKKEIIVYDYVDDNFKQTRAMFEKRRRTYEKLGYEIVYKD